jgi:hypothetical protein
MRSIYDGFIAELEELNTLIRAITPTSLAPADYWDSEEGKYILIRKRFGCAAFAVALYASFEKFVENIITEYVRHEARRTDYEALPEKLRKKHLARSGDLLSRRRLGVGRYSGLNELDVVKNLFDCLSGIKPYTLNGAAVIAHDVNLYPNEVNAVFSAIGIDNICDCARHADAAMTWYRDTNGIETPPSDGVSRTIIEERLKDIVERRNQAAHHGSAPITLPGDEAMSEAAAFIKSFVTSLFGIVAGRYLQAHHSESLSRVELTPRAGVDSSENRKIVTIEKPAQRLFIGQPVFVIVKYTGARWGRVQSLTVGGASCQELDADTNAPNGVEVGLNFVYPKGTNAKLIALQDDDEVVWSPLEPVSALITLF